jgi:hypothetical protein
MKAQAMGLEIVLPGPEWWPIIYGGVYDAADIMSGLKLGRSLWLDDPEAMAYQKPIVAT